MEPNEAAAGDSIEQAIAARAEARYILCLYITGTTAHSARALANIRRICEEHLHGRYDLDIVDVSRSPTLAQNEQIIAAPTLIKRLPLPLRRFIGDMSQTNRILVGLDLRAPLQVGRADRMRAEQLASQLASENAELRARLAEAEEMLGAIRRGEVDALVVESAAGPRVFTLEGVDAESNRFRGEILAQVSDAVIATDPQQRIIYLNPAAERQYGVAAVDVLGRCLDEIYEARWLGSEDEAAMNAALDSRGEWRGESTHVLRDGCMLRVESHFTVFRDGAIRGLLAVIRDVTERRRNEEAVLEMLREADRRKDEFLAILAHELRNPLAPVVNALQYLRMKGPSTPETEWARDVMTRQVQYLTRLIDDLMDVSRINRGRIRLKRERVELAHVVREAIEASLPVIQEMGHEFSIEMPADVTILEADTTRLAQVLLNLLNNAAKYTERGGKIELCIEPGNGRVAISVRDTGIGIPSDKLATIFEMFSQVDGALSRAQGGLGIGLYLVKRLVEMHDGTIEVRSEGPGKGSEFVVRLPVVAVEPQRIPLNESDVVREGVTSH